MNSRMSKPRIAILWCSHVRTGFKSIHNQLHHVCKANPHYDFDHYIHSYDAITATGWNAPGARWINPLDTVTYTHSYRDAIVKTLKPVKQYFGPAHADDADVAEKAISSSKGKGNLPASTHQFLKRSRAWNDFFADEADRKRYDAYVVTRFDNHFREDIQLPTVDGLTPHTYYAAWRDPRSSFLDDRFALITPDCDRFMRGWGSLACEFVARQDSHFFPESANLYAVTSCGMRVSHLHGGNPLLISRFTDEDKTALDNFIASAG